MSSVLQKILNRIECYVTADAFIILEAPFNSQFNNTAVVEEISLAKKIEAVYVNVGRGRVTLGATIKSRIDHGLNFYIYTINNEIVAFTWMLSNIPRFIDELGVSIDSNPKSLWVRDIFVLEEHRGKNIFSNFLSKIVSDFYQGNIETLRSDIYQSNNSSFQAHKKYGFKSIYKINYFTFFNRFLIRFLPKTDIKMSIFKKGQPLIKMDKAFTQHVIENIA